MKLSIIIPCYNEEKTINEVIFKINKVCIYDKEIIVIDDCSTDRSSEILETLINEKKISVLIKNIWKQKKISMLSVKIAQQ